MQLFPLGMVQKKVHHNHLRCTLGFYKKCKFCLIMLLRG